MPVLRKIGLLGGLLSVAVTLFAPVSVAYAQTAPSRPPLNIMTSPLPLNVVTKPGVPVTADIRVKNNGSQPETLKVELLKFGAHGDSGQPEIKDRNPQDLYFNWVRFSETVFDAEPNVWKTVHMTISPPREAAYGYYYAVLFSRANPNKATAGRSAVEGGVASLVLLSVDVPGSRRTAQVVSLTATRKVYEFLPADFTVKLHNAGNLHVAPTGTMFIKRGESQVATLDFNKEQGNILPNTNRVFSMEWHDGFPSYQPISNGDPSKTKLTWDFGKIQKLRFGRYTAQLVAVYDDGQRDVPVEAVVSFWVIPWRILGIILLLTIFIGGGFLAFMRLVWKNLKRQALVGMPTAPSQPVVPVATDVPVLPSKKLRKKDRQAASQQAGAVSVVVPPIVASPEPKPSDNTLAAALGTRKKRSLFGLSSRKKVTDQPTPTAPHGSSADSVDVSQQPSSQATISRKEATRNRQRMKSKQQQAISESQVKAEKVKASLSGQNNSSPSERSDQKSLPQQPQSSQRLPKKFKPQRKDQDPVITQETKQLLATDGESMPARQPKQPNPHAWAQPASKKSSKSKNKKMKHKKRHG